MYYLNINQLRAKVVLHTPPPSRAGIFKLLRSPGIDSKEPIPSAYNVAWRAGTITLFLLGRLFKNTSRDNREDDLDFGSFNST